MRSSFHEKIGREKKLRSDAEKRKNKIEIGNIMYAHFGFVRDATAKRPIIK